MRNKYPIQAIDVRFQVNHISPLTVQLREEYRDDPSNVNARLFIKLIRH